MHSGATAEISTPNHPSNYPTNLLCRWVVRSSEGRLSRISFASFRTERLYDAVRVCSGLHCDDTSLIASLNGSLFGSQAFVSRSNVLTIELQTDGMIGAAGFRATASNTNVPGPTSGIECTLRSSVLYNTLCVIINRAVSSPSEELKCMCVCYKCYCTW